MGIDRKQHWGVGGGCTCRMGYRSKCPLTNQSNGILQHSQNRPTGDRFQISITSYTCLLIYFKVQTDISMVSSFAKEILSLGNDSLFFQILSVFGTRKGDIDIKIVGTCCSSDQNETQKSKFTTEKQTQTEKQTRVVQLVQLKITDELQYVIDSYFF